MTSAQPPSILAVLANRDFRRLWLADVISDAGSFITFIALAVHVHDITGEAFAVGFALALRAIPWFTLGPIAGVIADRVDRRLMMVVCDVARAALVAVLPFTDSVGQAYTLAFASGLFGPIFRPARQALLPSVVRGDSYVKALALGEVSHQVLHTFGPALGGAAVLAVGARNAFFLDAGTFLVSALLVVGVGVRGATRGRPAGFADVRRDLVEGARIIWRDKILRSLVAVDAAILVGEQGAVAVGLIYVRETLHRGPGSYGIVLGAAGLGNVAGTLLLARRARSKGRILPLVASACGPAVLLFYAFEPAFAALIVMMFALGVAVSGTTLYVNTTLAERTPDEARGRAFGLSAAVLEMGEVIGALGVAAMVAGLGAGNAIALGGLVGAALALAALMPAVTALREADRQRAVPVVER